MSDPCPKCCEPLYEARPGDCLVLYCPGCGWEHSEKRKTPRLIWDNQKRLAERKQHRKKYT